MLNEVISIFAECLEKSTDEIKGIDEFRDYKEWDSLAYLSVIAAIDDKYNHVVPLEDFRSCRTVNALAEYLETHVDK
jgi:acyl carrier protein